LISHRLSVGVGYDLYGAGAYKLLGIMHSTATAAINSKAYIRAAKLLITVPLGVVS
jgi:hypothetical protein